MRILHRVAAGLALIAACVMPAPSAADPIKISAMTPATALTGTELIPGVQDGANVALTPSQIIALAAASFQPIDADLSSIAALTTTPYGRSLLTGADAPTTRSTLGLGSAATYATGTSGAAVPLLNGANSWAAGQTFSAGISLGAPLSIASGGTGVATQQQLAARVVHPGYVAGRWYNPFRGITMSTSAAAAAGAIRWNPFFLAQSITISDLAIYVNTAYSGGNVQLAVYAADASTKWPTGAALAATSNMSTTTVGVVSQTLGSTITIGPGLYWAAINSDNTTAQTTATLAGPRIADLIGVVSVGNALFGDGRFNLYTTQTFGSWPTLTGAEPTESLTGGYSGPVISLKVSAAN